MGAVSLGLSLGAMPIPGPGLPPPDFVIGLAGLVGGEARPGAQATIAYTMTPDTGTQTVQWGTGPNDATYGTGPNPTDFTAGDGSALWLTVTDGGTVVFANAPIRHAAPSATGALSDVIIALGATDPIATAGDFSFAGTPLYTLETAPAALTIDPLTGAIDASAVAAADQAPVVVRLADATTPGRFAESGFSLTVEDFTLTGTTDGEIEIGNASGLATITIVSPATYADYDAGNGPGVFIFDAADLAVGPVNLVPPRILDDGSPAAGETLTIVPGLWIYDVIVGGLTAPEYQWYADDMPVSGATSNTHLLSASQAGTSVTLRETLTDNAGARTASSAPTGVAGGTVWAAPSISPPEDRSVTIAAGANAPVAPQAPTLDSTGDGSVTLTAA